MKHIHSLEAKMGIFFGILTFAYIGTGIVSYVQLQSLTAKLEIVTGQENAIISAGQQILLAVSGVSSAISEAIGMTQTEGLDGLRREEAEFTDAVIRYDGYANALVYGSESEAFRASKGGLVYAQWKRSGLAGKIVVPQAHKEQIAVLNEVDSIFDDFVKESETIFSLKRKSFRLAEEHNDAVGEIVEKDIGTREVKLDAARGRMTEHMKKFVEESSAVIQGKNIELTALIGSLQTFSLIPPIMALMSMIAMFVISRTFIMNPLGELIRVARTFAGGNLSMRARESSKDELGELAKTFNEMAQKLQASRVGLEEQVAERTNQLTMQKEELEKMNKLMVDRELKMIQLKKENQELLQALEKK